MSLWDGLLGGAIGAELVSVVGGLIEKHGGVAGLVTQLERGGLGDNVRSWVSAGDNHPVSADQLHEAIGASTMADLAAKAGLTPEALAQKLAAVLPRAVDALTPGGRVA